MQIDTSVVLITGASRGLGREIARLFAERGARLILTARGAEALEDTAAMLRRLHGPGGRPPEVLAVRGDVGDAEHAERLVWLGRRRFGRIDVLINNASTLGASPMPRLDALDPQVFDEIVRTNVTAPLRLIQLVLPRMKVRKSGVIINITSDAAVEAYERWGAYGTSKAALEHLGKIWAAELAGTGVRLLTVDPGEMDTRMHADAMPEADRTALAKPDTIARRIVALIAAHTPNGTRVAVAV
jgi:NAD(P)-dependent dehydrogenase (short-subunit alcohol dehydrogenase family)